MCREPRRFIVSRDTLHFRQRTPTAGHPYDRLSIRDTLGELYNTPLSLLRRTVWSTSFFDFSRLLFYPLYIHLLQGVSRPLLSSLTSIFSQGSSAYASASNPNFSANDRRTFERWDPVSCSRERASTACRGSRHNHFLTRSDFWIARRRRVALTVWGVVRVRMGSCRRHDLLVMIDY
jgi:hypothetical protein